MSEHIYDDVNVPARYRPLLRRLQRGAWSAAELTWLLRTHRDLPPIVAAVVRQKLAEISQRKEPSLGD